MAKKVKRKLHIKIIPVILFLLFLVITFFCFKFLCKLPITNLYISGNSNLTDQEIIELAKLDNYPSFILTTNNKITKNIKKSPLIKEAKINKKFFGIIEITIKEYNILFRQHDNNENLVLENKKEIKDEATHYQIPKLLNYVPDNKYDAFINGMNQINLDVLTQISEITYVPNDQDKDRFLLYMNDGNYVYLTLTKFKQINYYEEVLKKLKGSKGILYLDSGNHFKIME